MKSKDFQIVRVGYRPFISWAPFFIACEEGFFKEQNIEIDFVPIGFKRNRWERIFNNRRPDVFHLAPTYNPFDVLDKDISIVAGATYIDKNNDFIGIAIRKDRDSIDNQLTLHDLLIGQKLGFCPSVSILEYIFHEHLGKHKIPLESIKIKLMHFSSMPSAIKDGDVRACIVLEPWRTIISNRCDIDFISFGDEFPRNSVAFILYGPLLKNNPELGTRFLLGYLKGCDQYSKGKTERNLHIVNKYIKLDQKTLSDIGWNKTRIKTAGRYLYNKEEILREMDWPIINPEGILRPDVMIGYKSWLDERSVLYRDVGIDSFIDTRFFQKASKMFSRQRKQ